MAKTLKSLPYTHILHWSIHPYSVLSWNWGGCSSFMEQKGRFKIIPGLGSFILHTYQIQLDMYINWGENFRNKEMTLSPFHLYKKNLNLVRYSFPNDPATLPPILGSIWLQRSECKLTFDSNLVLNWQNVQLGASLKSSNDESKNI